MSENYEYEPYPSRCAGNTDTLLKTSTGFETKSRNTRNAEFDDSKQKVAREPQIK